MSRHHAGSILGSHDTRHSSGPAAIATTAILVAALACVVGLRLTAEQLLPALSIVLILGGLVLAAVLRVAGSRKGSRSATWRDIAALIVFLGFAGAMLSDHGDALSLLGIDATPVASASAN